MTELKSIPGGTSRRAATSFSELEIKLLAEMLERVRLGLDARELAYDPSFARLCQKTLAMRRVSENGRVAK